MKSWPEIYRQRLTVSNDLEKMTMNTDQLRNNHKFYNGFEDEDEIVLSLEKKPEISIHVWSGYLDDILRKPTFDGPGWKGLTKDYHQLKGAFGTDSAILVHPEEYLADLQQYKERIFTERETEEVLQLLISFFERAVEERTQVIIQLI